MPPAAYTSETARHGLALRDAGNDAALLEQAIKLGDANRRYLGLLTPQAYGDYAANGTLLCTVDGDGRLLAYSAFRLPRDEIVIAHLVVDQQAKGRGLARGLVDEIGRRHQPRRGIKARCRRDFPANGMWPSLGFVALGDSPGRSRAGALLTTWWRDHGHGDLLSWDGGHPERLAAALDANVFFDLHAAAPGRAATTRALLAGLGDRVELLVTPELHNEINRGAHDVERAALHAAAGAYPSLTGPQDRVEAIEAAIIEARGGGRRAAASDRSDVRHVAWVAAAGVTVLVTRDERAMRNLGPAAEEVAGVRLVTPHDLVALVDEAEDTPSYRPEALLGTGYSVREAGDADRAALASFRSAAGGEAAKEMRTILRALAAGRPASRRLLVIDPAGQPVALIGAVPRRGRLEVPLLRVTARALRATLAAQAVSVVRGLAQEADVPLIVITDPHADAEVVEAALADGFGRASSGATAAVAMPGRTTARETELRLRGLLEKDEDGAAALGPLLTALATLATDPTQVNLAAAVEHRMRPAVVTDAELPSFLVPIKPAWSSELFGAPAQLYERPSGLGMSLEHVYYRSARPARESAPARVLWYVSAGGPLGSHAVACSQLAEVVEGPPAEIWRRFRRLGVYRRQDVEAAAGTAGVVRALRVADTRLLPSPVPHARLRQLAAGFGQTLNVQSPFRLSPALFAAVLEEAGDG